MFFCQENDGRAERARGLSRREVAIERGEGVNCKVSTVSLRIFAGEGVPDLAGRVPGCGFSRPPP